MADAGLVQKTLRVLQTVAASPNGIGLSGVARLTDIPKATCHRILLALAAEDWVVLNEDTKRFHMSLSVLLMLSPTSDRDTALSYVNRLLEALATQAMETCGLDQPIKGTNTVMVLAQTASPHNIGLGRRAVPRMQPAWSTSTGKVFLSLGDPEAVRQELEADALFRDSPRGRNLDGFLEELAETAERGYASSRDELEPGAASVACPVRVNGAVPYAIWVGGPTYRLTPERVPEIAGLLRHTAHDIERVLARTPPGTQLGPAL
ncbi:IclR family transcriptional regulator [Gordonia metallireducens]|uniref:IclR family transcriptional regulator n=1 Tax=Gordonia metallireducens TaxID=2897779 RepID=UPI001E3B29BF|nr:IclR family transcriptional regulator [Gordonia metallireducens]